MKMTVNLKDKSYDILLEDNLLDKISSRLDVNKRYFIVSDSGVPEEYASKLLKALPHSDLYVFPQGEKSKSFATYQAVLSELLKKGYSRKDYVIALGGGVVGDLSGFVAATFKRGMKFINIPTTVLAMVDSSIGGKVAVDFNNVKNAVGAFYQPEMVLIDPMVLKSLSQRQINNGLVEALKSGLIGDPALFELFKTSSSYINDIHEIIYRSLDVKRKVVEEDEKELNLRKILNFGHTFGHAYESYFNMEDYLHGESVAFGMLQVSKNESYYSDLVNILHKMNLDKVPSVDKKKMLDFMVNDKKADGNYIDLILVHEVGKAVIEKVKIADLDKYF